MKALILGGTGRAARHISEALKARHWQITKFDRAKDELARSARGADVIVYGWNPPYPKWQAECRAQLAEVIAVAETENATIFFPGNVYNFGQEPAPWDAQTPKNPVSSLGEIRVEMEAMLGASKAQTIILRAGDFIDTQPSGNWFDLILTRKINKGIFTYPGRWDAAHSWAFLPDFADSAARLIEARAGLALQSEFCFQGYTLTGEALALALEKHLGHRLKRKTTNWVPIHALAPVWPMGKCILEMRYLWDMPHSLGGKALQSRFPILQTTPLSEALKSIELHAKKAR